MSKSDIQAESHTDDVSGFDQVLVAFSRTVSGFRDAKTGRRGAAAIAPMVGMKAHVLANKANLALPEAEPTVTQFRAVMLAADDFQALDALNADCGRVCVPVKHFNATGDVGLLEQYTMLDVARGEVGAAIHAAISDKTLTKADIQRIRESTLREIEALEGMLARLNACAEPAKG